MFYAFSRNILFAFSAESVHYFSMNTLKAGCKIGFIDKWIKSSFQCKNDSLQKEVFGLNFKNPVGLGAGFDKNALYLHELEALGFGFVEVGTVTPLPQKGNDKPRLFRLPKDKALINRMGFNNDGANIIARRLYDWRTTNHKQQTTNLIVGGNIGKNKIRPNENAWKDYEICFNTLFDCVDYFAVNVSSPNTPGLRELQEKEALRKILSNLQNINMGKLKSKPLLLKIAPDLTNEQLDDIVALSLETQLDGLVATNTTISRDKLKTANSKLQTIGAGGLSGKPLQQKSTEILEYLSKQTGGKIPVIASGGIFTGVDAKEKLDAGASLVQLWTGFIYEGPAIVKKICRYLEDAKKL